MRRILFMLVLVAFFAAACGSTEEVERLAYQEQKLYLEADITLNDEYFPITMTLEAPEYDEEGKMYSRTATLCVSENSIISGVCFELESGQVYISSGDIRIPIEDTEIMSGVLDIVSLFCISDDFYYSSESLTVDKIKCRNNVFVDGDNRVEVLLDLSCNLPKSITALKNGRSIAADIRYIKAE